LDVRAADLPLGNYLDRCKKKGDHAQEDGGADRSAGWPGFFRPRSGTELMEKLPQLAHCATV
jgi:hypothetical protein